MTYWGWRPLILFAFISVLITACTDTHETAPSVLPTLPPSITLTIRGPDISVSATTPWLNPSTTLPHLEAVITEGAQVVETLPVGMQPTPTPITLAYDTPMCYPIPEGSIICMGLIKNTLSHGVERVVIQAALMNSSGDVLENIAQAVEQQYILPGAFAPYRVIFISDEGEWLPDVFGAVQVTLLRAETMMEGDVSALRVEDQQSEIVGGRYQMSALLHNDAAFDMAGVQVVGMAQDNAGHIAGYRMQEIPCVPAGETVRVAVDVLLNFSAAPLEAVLYAQGEQSTDACE